MFPFFSELPLDSRFHNLLTLASKDIAGAPSVEEAGSNMILQHQKLMLEHFGHKHHSVLLKNVIQRLLLGVSIIRNLRDPVLLLSDVMQYLLPYNLFSKIPLPLSFQSSCTLELASHLESKVITLKQEALKLMNLALAGTACVSYYLFLNSPSATLTVSKARNMENSWRS